MTKLPNAGSQQPGGAQGWLWAVRISLLVGILTCVPLVVESLYFVFVLAADLVLGGFLFKRPGKRTLVSCVVVGGLAFFFLGLPQALIPELGFSWELSLAFTIAHLSLALTAAEAQERLDEPAPLTPGSEGDPRWISTVYALTVISTVPGWAIATIAFVASRRGPCADKSELYWLALLPVFLPHLDILWHLRKRTRARGLGLAIAMGVGWLLVAAFPAFVSWDKIEKIITWVVAFAILQLGLSIMAFIACRSMAPAYRDWWQIVRGFALLVAYALIGFVALILASAPLTRSRQEGNQVSAVGSLRLLVTAEITYASMHEENYSPSLAALGGPSNHESTSPGAAEERLIDESLAAGTKLGYKFTYTPGPPDASGQISSFTVTAQPSRYGESGCIGFFSDESGVIRSTREDRPPTAADPPLQG